ncbi:hypothetical protein CTS44_03331 [Comamonas thiooxydans]|nr:hypothetical protein CTS44_03331 [Comamonas thiooxydans]
MDEKIIFADYKKIQKIDESTIRPLRFILFLF